MGMRICLELFVTGVVVVVVVVEGAMKVGD